MEREDHGKWMTNQTPGLANGVYYGKAQLANRTQADASVSVLGAGKIDARYLP